MLQTNLNTLLFCRNLLCRKLRQVSEYGPSVVVCMLERFYIREKYFYYKARHAISCAVNFYKLYIAVLLS
jgi:hypothetical protein